jgi:hypothetical protein
MAGLTTTGALGAGSIAAGFGAIDNGTSGIRTNTVTVETSLVPDANDDADIGTTSLGFNDIFLADSGAIKFGNDQDVTLTHSADTGLILDVGATVSETFTMVSSQGGTPEGPILTLHRNSASPDDNDYIGAMKFKGRNDQGQDVIYAGIAAKTVDITDTTEDAVLIFSTIVAGSNVDTMKITAGNVGIRESTPQYTFEVGNATDGDQGFGVNLENNSAKTYYMASAEDTQTHAVYQNGNGVVGSIKTVNSTTQFNTSSDYRLKENIDYTWDATSRLKELKPARFSFKANKDETLEEILLDGTNGSSADAGGKILFEDETHMIDGFIAHEVTGIVDAAVTGDYDSVVKWQSWETDVLPDGVSVGDDKLDDNDNVIIDPQGIDQAKLVPLLVKTIQELEARITALEA